jgi:mono/diheme cytochrome c family protein
VLGVATAAAAQDAKVAKGQQVFTDQKCSLCHSIAGKGNAKGSLDGVGTKLSADEIRSWIHRCEGMTAKTQGDPQARDEGVHAAEGRRGRARGVLELVEEVAAMGS